MEVLEAAGGLRRRGRDVQGAGDVAVGAGGDLRYGLVCALLRAAGQDDARAGVVVCLGCGIAGAAVGAGDEDDLPSAGVKMGGSGCVPGSGGGRV